MVPSVTEENSSNPVTSQTRDDKPAEKARGAAGRRKEAQTRGGSKRAAVGQQSAKIAGRVSARSGSKTAKVLSLLRRPKGALLNELMKATGWQAHSVRGFLSGTLRKKMGLEIASANSADGERRYSLSR
jgi:uncharacterized protein DUF3489